MAVEPDTQIGGDGLRYPTGTQPEDPSYPWLALGGGGATTLAELDTTVTGAQLDAMKTKVDGVEAFADVTGAVIEEGDGSPGSLSVGPTTPSAPVNGDVWADTTV